MFFMNKKKTAGLILSCLGIICSRIDTIVIFDNSQMLFFIKMFGTLLALSGIIVFAAGIKVSETIMKTCPECYSLNDVSRDICSQCKKPLTKGD